MLLRPALKKCLEAFTRWHASQCKLHIASAWRRTHRCLVNTTTSQTPQHTVPIYRQLTSAASYRIIKPAQTATFVLHPALAINQLIYSSVHIAHWPCAMLDRRVRSRVPYGCTHGCTMWLLGCGWCSPSQYSNRATTSLSQSCAPPVRCTIERMVGVREVCRAADPGLLFVYTAPSYVPTHGTRVRAGATTQFTFISERFRVLLHLVSGSAAGLPDWKCVLRGCVSFKDVKRHSCV